MEKEAVMQARAAALVAQFRALRLLASKDPVRATEINIENMQYTLEKANTIDSEGNILGIQESIGQFREIYQFNAKIIQIAQALGGNLTAIHAINAQAMPGLEETLNNIFTKM